MSGLTATVLLRSSFTLADSGRVTEILRTVATDVADTRKGRHWEFVANESAASLSVLSTLDRSHDIEDDLVANGLDFDDAPEAIVLSFPTRRDCDRDVCAKLAAELAESFGGINCGIEC